MTDFNFDDPFADNPDNSAQNAGPNPFGDDPFGDSGVNLDQAGDVGLPGESAADLPENLGAPLPERRSRTFVIALGVLALIMVVALGIILFVAQQQGVTTRNYDNTLTAIAVYNNGVLTAEAATAIAKSWSPTPSKTPTPTITLTPTLTLSPTLTNTITPSPTNTNVPGVTPSATFTPSVTPTVTITPPDQSGLETQNARLQSAATDLAVEQTVIASGSNTSQRKTEAAQYNAAQTAIAAQLTQNAQAASGNAGANTSSNATTPTETLPAPLASPSLTATPFTSSAQTSTPSQAGSGALFGDGVVSVLYIHPIAYQDTAAPPSDTPAPQVTNSNTVVPPTDTPVPQVTASFTAAPPTDTPVSQVTETDTAEPLTDTPLASTPTAAQSVSQVRSPTPIPLSCLQTSTKQSEILSAVTMTVQAINNDNQRLYDAQTAIAGQEDLDATTPTATAVLTENAQLSMGQTAIAVQLSQNATAVGSQKAAFPPCTGLYEDLAGGRATPGTLALFGVAAVGLVGVIVAARRLRIR